MPTGPAAARRLARVIDDGVDDWFDRALRGRPAVDRFFYAASEAANFSLLWHAIGALLGLRSEADRRAAVRLSVCLGIESALVNGGVKSLFRRSRPEPAQEHPHGLRQPVTSSFPSGHASAAMVAASLLSEQSRVRAPWYVAGVAVAVSRIHVRIHHATDVVGGLVIGLALGSLARRLWPLDSDDD